MLWAGRVPVSRLHTVSKSVCVLAQQRAGVSAVRLGAPGMMSVDVRWHFSQHLSVLSRLACQAHEATDLLHIGSELSFLLASCLKYSTISLQSLAAV